MLAGNRTEPSDAASLQRFAGMTVLSLLALAAVAGAMGCAGTPEPVTPLSRAERVPYRSLDLLKENIVANSQWQTLEASCDLTILNPSIPTPGNTLILRGGRIAIDRGSHRISLTAAGQDGSLRLVGDGSIYESALLGQVYRGKYGDSLSAEPAVIHLMPDDLADAFDPAGLFWEQAVTLTQGPLFSQIHTVDFIEEPVPQLKMTSTITIDRRRESNLTILKYDPDGSVRVQVGYLTVRPFTTGGDESVPAEIATRLRIDYPQDPTAILMQLTNVQLDVKLDQDQFTVNE